MMLLTKEVNEKDRQLKSQLLLATSEIEKKQSQTIWRENGFLGNISSDFNIHKKHFSENALCYINQAHLSTKDGEIIVYCQYAILGQVIPWQNTPDNIDDHVSNNDHLVKMYMLLYDNNDGLFRGIKETVGYVMLRGERDETFWTYDFNEEKSNILYCSAKQPMPNVGHRLLFGQLRQVSPNNRV